MQLKLLNKDTRGVKHCVHGITSYDGMEILSAVSYKPSCI